MEENTDINKVFDINEELEEVQFQYDFINMPWDDRTTKSKTCIVTLLVSIFVVTMALIINNFYMHYKYFTMAKKLSGINNNTCYRIGIEEFPFVARLHSASSHELLCLGAVVSPTSVLANGVCVKFGQLRMYLGSPSEPRCRKGFSVDVFESIHHPGVFSNRLVLLSSYDDIQKCSDPVTIGDKLDWTGMVHVVGRPYSRGRILPLQHLTLITNVEDHGIRNLRINSNYSVVARGIGRCPVRAGDLMLQNGQLFGLAAYQRNKISFFADLDPIKTELKEIDADIEIENFQWRYKV